MNLKGGLAVPLGQYLLVVEIINIQVLNENYINDFFEATGDIVEESIINSLIYAKSLVGINEHKRISLSEYLGE